jgi:hypothetical protein
MFPLFRNFLKFAAAGAFVALAASNPKMRQEIEASRPPGGEIRQRSAAVIVREPSQLEPS